MALIGANELKRKMLITIEKQPYAILDVFFASPSARGASTMVRTKLRNLITRRRDGKNFQNQREVSRAGRRADARVVFVFGWRELSFHG